LLGEYFTVHKCFASKGEEKLYPITGSYFEFGIISSWKTDAKGRKV
jgi:hypothetical protein